MKKINLFPFFCLFLFACTSESLKTESDQNKMASTGPSRHLSSDVNPRKSVGRIGAPAETLIHALIAAGVQDDPEQSGAGTVTYVVNGLVCAENRSTAWCMNPKITNSTHARALTDALITFPEVTPSNASGGTTGLDNADITCKVRGAYTDERKYGCEITFDLVQ